MCDAETLVQDVEIFTIQRWPTRYDFAGEDERVFASHGSLVAIPTGELVAVSWGTIAITQDGRYLRLWPVHPGYPGEIMRLHTESEAKKLTETLAAEGFRVFPDPRPLWERWIDVKPKRFLARVGPPELRGPDVATRRWCNFVDLCPSAADLLTKLAART